MRLRQSVGQQSVIRRGEFPQPVLPAADLFNKRLPTERMEDHRGTSAIFLSDGCAQLRDDFLRRLDRRRMLIDRE